MGTELVILGVISMAGIIALAGVLLGFRMGRIKSDDPVVPPQVVESGPPMREEDPYHEAMYGVPQERIPTVEVKV
jgi:hypothetical protein